jgi:hypothetical protein
MFCTHQHRMSTVLSPDVSGEVGFIEDDRQVPGNAQVPIRTCEAFLTAVHPSVSMAVTSPADTAIHEHL